MEHALVFVSIIVGVAVTDEIVSLHRLLRARRRVRWDALPLAVAALVMLLLVRIWWAAAQPATASVTIAAFLPDLVELILLVLLAAAVLPDEVPAEGLDLRAFYHDEGRYIWSLFTLAFGWTIASQIVTIHGAGAPLPRAVMALGADLVFLIVTASLIVVRRRWWRVVVLAPLSVGPLQWLSRSLA